MNALLVEKNTKISVTIGFPRDGSPVYSRPVIETEKLDRKKRVGPLLAIPTFCPFCGVRYEPAS